MSRQKKTAALLLILTLLLTGCAGTPSGDSDAPAVHPTLSQRGLEVAALLDEMVHSESYFRLMTAGDQLAAEVARLAEGDYTTPSEAYRITVPDHLIDEVIERYAALDDSYSPALRSFLTKRMLGTVATTLNAREGATALAASSLFTASLTFVSDEPANGYLIYLYDDAQPVLVTFTAGEGGAVTASGSILVSEELRGLTLGRLKELLDEALSQFGSEAGLQIEEAETQPTQPAGEAR
ncbi:MAG: hypothetical protein IJC43_07360 [Clostridia bacterium]|nr:hypothetical protein [Clostridia bacterium]